MKKILTSISSGIITTFVPLIAAAQGPITGDSVFNPQGQTLPGGSSALGLRGVIGVAKKVADWLFTALLILAVIMIIIAAFRYLFAAGNDDRIKKANQGLLYAAVAIAVGLLAQAIVFIVASIVSPGAI